MLLKKKKKDRPIPKAYLGVMIGIIVFGLGLYFYQRSKPDFPEDPKQAVAQVSKSMKRADTVQLEFVHNIGENLEDPDFVVAGVADVQLPNEYVAHAEVTGDETVLAESPVPQAFDFAYVNDTHYFREQDKAEWRDYSEVPDYTPFLRVEPMAFLDFAVENANIVRENDQEIDGQNYGVFTFSFSEEKAPEVLKPLALLISDVPSSADVTVRIFVHPKTYKLYKLIADVVVADIGGERLELTYREYNFPPAMQLSGDIEKQAPPSDEEVAASEEESNRLERNEERQIEMLAIKAALEKSYEENNVYPEAPDGINLNGPESEVAKQLLTYLKEIPADPIPDEYYYGYRCEGGEQYELTGIQETEDGTVVVKLTQSSIAFEEVE